MEAAIVTLQHFKGQLTQHKNQRIDLFRLYWKLLPTDLVVCVQCKEIISISLSFAATLVAKNGSPGFIVESWG